MSDANCIFCKIIKGDIPCTKVAETENSLCFMDINPLSSGHLLIIPKHHAAKLHELPEESMKDIGPMLVRVAKAMNIDDYNVLQNNGRIANQAVDHVHFHIIPKPNKNDGLCLSWKPKEGDMAAIGKRAEEIKNKL